MPSSTTQLLGLVVLLTCLVSISSAAVLYIPEQMVETPKALQAPAPAEAEDLASAIARLAKSGPILVDHSPPPKPKDWTLATIAEDLRRRQVGGSEESSGSSSSSTASRTRSSTATPTDAGSKTASSSSVKPSSTTDSASTTTSTSSSGIAAATDAVSSPLPRVFDNGFNGNLTANCDAFMTSMITNASFVNCQPFSLLLQNSNSFFQASKSVTRISQTLDASCAANVTTCANLLSSFASNITSTTACAADLATQNPLVAQAQLGLLAYKSLYTASCLRNPATSSYCFADAVTNKSSPTDSYIYYLPLNVSLPGGSQPTCSKCLKDTMAVFAAASGESGSALKTTYVPAAMQVNVQCGPTFTNASLSTPASLAASTLVPSGTGLLALLVVGLSWLL